MTKEPDEIRRRYLRCLAQYNEPPRGVDDRRVVEIDLAQAEHDLLEHPPFHRNSGGIWCPRSKGLITADEARAGATPDGLKELEAIEMPKGPCLGDDFKLIPERELDDAFQQKKRDEALNKPLLKFVLDQNGHGSCTCEGYTSGVLYCEEKQKNKKVELLNPLGLYGLINGGRDGGSALSDAVSVGAKRGVPSEAVWPRSNGWRRKLSDDAKHDALKHRAHERWRVRNVLEYKNALVQSLCVFSAYPGHAWLGVEYRDRLRFDWLNSWGPDFGDGGYSTLRYSSIAFGHGAWAFRVARRAE